ncbi:hypothetical protein [Thermolongibacillus altinsuensis]|uniref:hypothetical protein n=1 Tax=Thermolongibacillus altinsuensis TaxID=575256 RepID=UPI0025551F7D|nr:hypothetical protein [Thermolongibacillus altinsuensis]
MKTKAGHMNIKAVKSVQKRKEVELQWQMVRLEPVTIITFKSSNTNNEFIPESVGADEKEKVF